MLYLLVAAVGGLLFAMDAVVVVHSFDEANLYDSELDVLTMAAGVVVWWAPFVSVSAVLQSVVGVLSLAVAAHKTATD